MQIFFCEKCSARLSNADLDRGDAVVYDGEVYCYHCVPEGVDPDALPKAKKKGSRFNIPAAKRRSRSSTDIKPRGRRSPAGTARPARASKRQPSSTRLRPGSSSRTRAASSGRTRPPSARQRPVGQPITVTPKGVVLMAAVLGVAVATVAFFAMRALG